MAKEMKNRDLLQEVAKQNPLFGKSQILWDASGREIGNALQSQNSVAEFAGKEVYRTLDAQACWAYKDSDQVFIADQVAPFYPVTTLAGQYRKIAERTFFDRPETNTGKNTPPRRIDWSDSLVDFDLTGRALAIYLSRVDLDEAKNQYGSEQKYRDIARQFLTRLLILDRELTVADMYQTPATYFASGYYTTASPLWSENTATILADTHTGEDKLYMPRDTTIMAHNVYRALQKSSVVVGATTVGGSSRNKLQPYVNQEAIENYLDSKIIVGSARYNSSPESSTPTMSRIWENYVTLAHLGSNPGDDLAAPAVRTFKLKSSAFPNYEGWTVKTVRDDSTVAGGEILMVGYFCDEVVFGQKNMYSIKALND